MDVLKVRYYWLNKLLETWDVGLIISLLHYYWILVDGSCLDGTLIVYVLQEV